MAIPASIHKMLGATLVELGMPAPADYIQTMLVRDGYFVGYKFGYDGGHAILQASANVLEFYDESGKSLKKTAVESDRQQNDQRAVS